MILFQSINHLFQSHNTRRCDYACLTHSTAQNLSQLSSPLNEFASANQQRANWATQAFRQTKHQIVNILCEFFNVNSQRNGSVKNSRSIQVKVQVMFLSDFAYCLDLIGRYCCSAMPVVSVLKANEGWFWEMDVLWSYGGFDVFWIKHPKMAFDWPWQQLSYRGDAA